MQMCHRRRTSAATPPCKTLNIPSRLSSSACRGSRIFPSLFAARKSETRCRKRRVLIFPFVRAFVQFENLYAHAPPSRTLPMLRRGQRGLFLKVFSPSIYLPRECLAFASSNGIGIREIYRFCVEGYDEKFTGIYEHDDRCLLLLRFH